MTPSQLAKQISLLPATVPITVQFEKDLTALGMWNSEKESCKYTTQKGHWRGWLRGYSGAGFYHRTSGQLRTAEYVYNHIMCPPMLLWLPEAAGVSKATVLSAKKSALSVKQTFPSQCAAIREIIPWKMVENALNVP